MNAHVWKYLRGAAVVTFLVAGCGGQEPIPVDLATAKGPCAEAEPFLSKGMRMVMRDGHVTVEAEDERVRAFYPGMGGGGGAGGVEIGDGMESPCLSCH